LLLAQLTYGDELSNLQKPFITLCEPACGAGGMVLAFAKTMRPSIDVLFKSAAEVFEASLIAVILSGANSDGAEGMVCLVIPISLHKSLTRFRLPHSRCS